MTNISSDTLNMRIGHSDCGLYVCWLQLLLSAFSIISACCSRFTLLFPWSHLLSPCYINDAKRPVLHDSVLRTCAFLQRACVYVRRFIIFTLHHILLWPFTSGMKSWAVEVSHMGKMKSAYKFQLENPNRINQLGDVGVDGIKILK